MIVCRAAVPWMCTPFANSLAVQSDGHRLINRVDSVKIAGSGSRHLNVSTVLYRRLNGRQVQRLEICKRAGIAPISAAFLGVPACTSWGDNIRARRLMAAVVRTNADACVAGFRSHSPRAVALLADLSATGANRAADQKLRRSSRGIRSGLRRLSAGGR